MGYDLRITRKETWTDTGNEISIDEFERYLKTDIEFSYPSKMGPNYAEWKSPNSSYTSWLCWDSGDVYTKNPEPEFIDKMESVAKALQAKVVGDDGEIYETAELTIQPEKLPEGSVMRAGTFRWEDLPAWKQAAILVITLALFQVVRDRKSTRLNSSHLKLSRMPSSA